MQTTNQRSADKATRRNFRHSSSANILRGKVHSDTTDATYNVELNLVTMKASCDCPAGARGKDCKHVRRFIERNQNRIARGIIPGEARHSRTAQRLHAKSREVTADDLEEIAIQAQETADAEAELAELTAADLAAAERYSTESEFAAYRWNQVIAYHAKGGF